MYFYNHLCQLSCFCCKYAIPGYLLISLFTGPDRILGRCMHWTIQWLYAVCYLQRNSYYSVVLAVLLFFYYLFFLHAFFVWDDGHIIVFGKLYCCFYNAVAWKMSVRVMLRKSIFIACSFVSKLNRWHAVYTLLFCAKCELRCWDYTVWTKRFPFQIRCLISKVKLRGFRVGFPRIIIIIQVTQVQRKKMYLLRTVQ